MPQLDDSFLRAKDHLVKFLSTTKSMPEAKAKHVTKAGYSNLVSVGIGYKNNEKEKGMCLTVGVIRKLPQEKILTENFVEKTFDDITTDVIEVSRPRPEDDLECYNPLKGGSEIWNIEDSVVGTLGAIVYDKDGNDQILSNNHVIARQNSASLGELICQPGIRGSHDPLSHPEASCGPYDFCVAELSDFEELTPTSNMDAAVAKILEDTRPIKREIIDIGTVSGEEEAQLSMKVRKRGRTTLLTYGEITRIRETVFDMPYRPGRTDMDNSMVIEPRNKDYEPIDGGKFSDEGDSGSLIVNEGNNAVGLLYGGGFQRGIKVTYANHIQPIVERFKISFV